MRKIDVFNSLVTEFEFVKIWKLKKRKRKGRDFKRALKRYKIVGVLVIVNPVGANGGVDRFTDKGSDNKVWFNWIYWNV